MIDVVKAILRKLYIDLEDVKIQRRYKDLENGLSVPTNDWSMMFIFIGYMYKEYIIEIELTKIGTEDPCMFLFKSDGIEIIKHLKVELADKTAEELLLIIKNFMVLD